MTDSDDVLMLRCVAAELGIPRAMQMMREEVLKALEAAGVNNTADAFSEFVSPGAHDPMPVSDNNTRQYGESPFVGCEHWLHDPCLCNRRCGDPIRHRRDIRRLVARQFRRAGSVPPESHHVFTLRAIAKQLGIRGSRNMNKPRLVEVLKATDFFIATASPITVRPLSDCWGGVRLCLDPTAVLMCMHPYCS
jgi:hypothetical protein